MAFGVYLNSVTRDGPLVQNSALPPSFSIPRLALKLFRREPAISKFVWNFSATHTSSPHFFNVRGSVLQCFYRTFNLTWVDHMVSGLRLHTHSPYSDSLSLRLRLFDLTSHAIVTRRFILQKVRHHSLNELLTCCRHTVSGSISLPFRGAFHLSLTVLVHYRSLGVFSPCGMVPADSDGISRVPPYSGSS